MPIVFQGSGLLRLQRLHSGATVDPRLILHRQNTRNIHFVNDFICKLCTLVQGVV